MIDEKYMSIAVSNAKEAAMRGDVPVGAVIVQKIADSGLLIIENKIVSSGCNKKNNDPTAHAEISAIREACEKLGRWNLSDCELYVTLEPCPMCAGAIVQSRISRVIYGCADPKAGAAGTLYNILCDSRLNHRCKITSGVLAEECKALLTNFFKERRDKKMSMFLSYGRQWVNDDDINEVVKVLKSDWLSQGPMIERFENSVAEYVGAKYAVAFSNGTAALHAAMYASGLKEGDKGITSPMTFAATSNSMLYVGAEPVFADITHETCCLDPVETESKMTGDVKVIAPVSFAAYPVDIGAFREIADKWGAVLIEDGCQALGAERNGVKVGCEADMTVFSFHPVKSITTGEGGMVTTDNPEYARSMKLFRTHGITKNPDDFEYAENASSGWYGEMQILGYNYRLTDFQCVLGLSQLKRLPEFIERRREIAALYFKKLDGTPHLKLQPYHEGHGWHLFIIFVDPDKRLGLFNHLKDNDIGAQVHYVPVHLHPYYRRRYGYTEGMFPKAEEMYRSEISIPIFPAMSNADVDRVAGLIKDYLEQA